MKSDPTLVPAALLLAALVAVPLALCGRGRLSPAQAGPLEAERLYDLARTKRKGPWPAALRAYRAVLAEAGRADPSRRRAWKAIAGVLHAAGRPHGAQAALTAAAHAGRRTRAEAGLWLACARALRDEGDQEAAHHALEALLSLGIGRAPKEVGAALVVLGEDAFDAGDRARLTALVEQMETVGVDLPERIRAWGRLGELHLRAQDRKAATRCLRAAEACYDASREDRDEKRARVATRLWLDLPLRKALDR